MVLKQRLQLCMKGSNTVSDYLHTVKAIASKLAIIDKPVSIEDLNLYILNGLGSEFKEFSASLRTCDDPFSF